MKSNNKQFAAMQRAFTIIELLVVIGIIGVLAAIVLVAGGKVVTGGKRTATQDVMRVLDTSLEAYMTATDGKPAALAEVVTNAGGGGARETAFYPVADANDGSGNVINSLALYMYQAGAIPTAKAHLDTVPPKFVGSTPIRTPDAAGGTPPTDQPTIPTVLDAWGRPIRYVHPAFDGVIVADAAAPPPGTGLRWDALDVPPMPRRTPAATAAFNEVRRNAKFAGTGGSIFGADGDGGSCIGNRPYFYSLGEDGKNGQEVSGANPVIDRTEDNVYTNKPNLPKSGT